MAKNLPNYVDIRSLDKRAVVEIAETLGKEVRIDDKDEIIAPSEFCIDDIPYNKLMEYERKGEIYLGPDIALLNSKTGKPVKYARTCMDTQSN